MRDFYIYYALTLKNVKKRKLIDKLNTKDIFYWLLLIRKYL